MIEFLLLYCGYFARPVLPDRFISGPQPTPHAFNIELYVTLAIPPSQPTLL